MNTRDTFKITCSFLNPLELINCRKLSRHCNIWTNEFLFSKFKTINIEKYACPKCGDFIDQSDISNYTDFNDYFLSEQNKIERLSKINEWFNKNYIFDVERKNILCDNCEIIEDYDDNFYLRYKGSRRYTLNKYFSLYSWASLCIIDYDEQKGYWNEYRKPLSCTFEEFSSSEENIPTIYWNTWDNEEEYEEEYDQYNFEYDNQDNEEDY